MRIRLVEIRLRASGKRVRIERDLDVGVLRIGRGPDNDLSLKGLTISLHHATLRAVENRIRVEAAPGKTITVDGLVTAGSEWLGNGSRLKLGAWELRVIDPLPGFDVALEYEEVDRPDDERAALDLRTRIGIESGVFSRRLLSWLGILAVLGAFLAVPLLLEGAQSPWNTGDVSRGHAYIEGDCGKCHSGFFRGVRNADCMECHHDVGRHAPPEIEMKELDDRVCASCHLEHRGRDIDLADLGSGFCSECHADITKRLATTELRNASDFGTEHPPFNLSVVTDPLDPPASVERTPELVEESGLIFNHLHHVGRAVSGRDELKQYLKCGACHQPDAGGLYMQPIEFEKHCQDCHRLDFDPAVPADFTPHGDPVAVRTRIRGFYSAQVLAGDVRDPEAPPRLRLRRPGATLDADEAELSRRWVESKLAAAERRFYDRPGTCATCHTLQPGAASDGGMGIAPVQIQTTWVPGSAFSHASHSPFPCVKCHPAAGVFDPDPDADLARPSWSETDAVPYGLIDRAKAESTSERAADIMIPALETCRECHTGAKSTGGDKVPSPCSMCHPFHVRAHGPMTGSPVGTEVGDDLVRPPVSLRDSYQPWRPLPSEPREAALASRVTPLSPRVGSGR